MTKKHFVALADALRNARPIDWESDGRRQWHEDVDAVAMVCGKMNSRFDRERWMDYVRGLCGPNGGGR